MLHTHTMISLFSVEGNIASGKSTLLQKLGEAAAASGIRLLIVSQPIDDDWLQRFYEDMSSNAFAFQIITLTKKLKAIVQACYQARQYSNVIIVTERSMHSDTTVFTAALQSLGHIDGARVAVITELCQTLESMFQLLQVKEKGFIYLKTDVNECYQRCRSRYSSNKQLSEDYLRILEGVHNIMLDCRQLPHYILSSGYTSSDVQMLLGWMLSVHSPRV